MDTTELEKKFHKSLPPGARIKNKIFDIFDVLGAIAGFFGIAIGAVLFIIFRATVGPFVLSDDFAGYYLKKR